MRVYVAGPIAGRANGNKEAFALKAEELKAAGYEPVNPWDIPGGPHEGPCIGDRVAANNLEAETHRYGCYLREDIRVLMYCDAITFLDEWELSRGARTEHHVAMSIGLPILEFKEASWQLTASTAA